jgi:hypothetical protein
MLRLKLLTTILGTIGLSFFGSVSSANAMNLIPQREGEIKMTNMQCIANTCIDTSKELGYKVTSQSYNRDYGLSRLFVDNRATENTWFDNTANNNKGFRIKFLKQDEGTNTNADEFWFRPVAFNKSGKTLENGRLEVGRFLFDFGRTFSKVSLDFFDVEASGFSGILEINGKSVKDMLLKAGPDGNTQTLTVKDVSSLLIQLGQPKAGGFSTGDGVSLAGIRAVPEPGSVVGLGTLAVAGIVGLRQRRKSSVA